LSDAELIERFAPSGAIPSEVLTNPELRAVCLPALRADVRWADAYHVAPEEAITAPISVLFGSADPEYTPERVREWSARTLGESLRR
jgi:pyochelin biosynthetic protein PchC